MAVVAAGLPPLLPTPTRCVGIRPPPPWYASPRRFESTTKPAGRASFSDSWIADKERCQEAEKMPGRASLSSSWVDDRKKGRAGTSTWGVERASRPTWRDNCWSGGKRPASRAPSAAHGEKKHKPLIFIEAEAAAADTVAMETKTEAAHGTTIATETKTEPAPPPATTIVVEAEAGLAPELVFAGPSFVQSPDPSMLPLPISFMGPSIARMIARYLIAESSGSEFLRQC